ncbi:GreA/GreB family elongation factor [Sinobacterium caligoides]|uniref:GreA/GreB family elongation factor n=1 Tax=Sinobacterium caligoides TaxID=933926 RepID=A0A3N2DNK3_9GAMM|nr:GreA/GreB family elongation factor [Sinobacterium caligoides]ROS01383.1 GreA/GreB family elongation factor [Sinobacterium caligoides]
MNKEHLLQHIIASLEALKQVAIDAAMQAYRSATDDENVAENKYDTLGLEASYLAQGQAERVDACEADLAAYRQLALALKEQHTVIALGSLVRLIDDEAHSQWFLLGPAAGGHKVVFEDKTIMLITPSSPLGRELLGKEVFDEVVTTVATKRSHFEIAAVS